jgi:hypothetical protein
MGMTDRLVRPIRAWAEYEEYLLLLDTTVATWRSYLSPMTGEGVPHASGGSSIVACIRNMNIGPLRSLRVLYENGCELKLEAPTAMTPEWLWFLNVDSENLPDDVESPEGMFSEDKDSEAVERAMIAASAWFTQADPATLGIDSPPPEPAS